MHQPKFLLGDDVVEAEYFEDGTEVSTSDIAPDYVDVGAGEWLVRDGRELWAATSDQIRTSYEPVSSDADTELERAGIAPISDSELSELKRDATGN